MLSSYHCVTDILKFYGNNYIGDLVIYFVIAGMTLVVFSSFSSLIYV